MKKSMMLILAILLTNLVSAQNGFNYKALITNNGNVLGNHSVTIQFTVLENGTTNVYQETHTTTTDANGIVSVNLGEGISADDFSLINWGNLPYFLKVEIDSGNGYQNFGTNEFKYIPLAKYADKVGSVDFNDITNIPSGLADGDDVNDADHSPTNEIQHISKSGSTVTLSNGGGTFTDAVNDADHSTTNELQTLSVNGTQLSISNGNTVTLPSSGGASEINDLTDGRTIGNSVFLGDGAGQNDDGSNNVNVGVGHQTLNANTTGYGNSATGVNALYKNTTGYSNVAIGASSLYKNTDRSNLVAVGDGALYHNGDNATQFYHATGNTAIGSKTLYENATGYNNSATGYNALYANTTGHGNTATGYQALFDNTTGHDNTATGLQALTNNTTGGGNSATGLQALYKNTTGSYNSTTGFQALYENTTGSFNSATGIYALYKNTTGHSNVAMGVSSLYKNTDRSNLVAVGDSALYHNGENATLFYHATENSAIGSKALYANTTGYYNTAMGDLALYSNITGHDNTAMGDWALYSNITGNENTALGSVAYFTVNNLSNTTCIGYNSGGISNVSNRIEIGNGSVTWIGGQVTWSTYSDKRIKKDIQANVAGLDFITRLRPVTYHLDIHKQNEMVKRGKKGKKEADWPEKYDIENQLMSGFIAQEVEQAAQGAGYDFSGVQQAKDDLGMYSVSYAQFVVPLVKATQELNEKNNELKAENQALKQKVEAQQQKLETLQQQNENIQQRLERLENLLNQRN